MYLTMKSIQDRIDQTKIEIIENSQPDNFGQVNYDLRVEKIIVLSGEDSENKSEYNKYDLPAGDTIFVATAENLNMPLDLIGIIIPKNSNIRTGLRIDAPVYQPGHHTKVFIRVTNISKNDIQIKENMSIASIMFAKLDNNVEPYKGRFVNEFDYTGVGDFSAAIPKTIKISKKMESIENIEKRLYEKVVALLTVFVGIFSLFNLNIQFLNATASLQKMLIYNLISIGGLGLLVGFISFIINTKSKINWFITILSILLIASTFFILPNT